MNDERVGKWFYVWLSATREFADPYLGQLQRVYSRRGEDGREEPWGIFKIQHGTLDVPLTRMGAEVDIERRRAELRAAGFSV